MKYTYRPGTPEEVVANLHRVRGKGGQARVLGRAGTPLAGRDVETEAESLKGAGAVITAIHKIGFPAATPHGEAIDKALATIAEGRPLTAEIVQTPEHEAAGEYLVKILVVGSPS